jgi:hypothetical protein
MSLGTSNKFAVLQVSRPHQPSTKEIKTITSIPGAVPNLPKKLKDNSANIMLQEALVDRDNNNNNRGGSGGRGGDRGGRGGNRGGSRGGRGGNRGGNFVAERSTQDNRSERPSQDKPRDPNQPLKRNKRIYDRNSNVPKGDSKKGGVGTGNWGNEKEDPQRGVDDAKKELDAGEQPEVKVDESPIVEQEPEDKTITFKEYQEQRAALAPKFDAPKRREANEGEKNDLHKYVVLKKDDEEEEKLHIKPKKEKAKKQPKKQTIALSDLGVQNSPSGYEDRRGPKKYNNNYKKQQKKVNLPIEDTDSFPALK